MLWAAGMTGLSDRQAPWLTVSLRISRTALEFSIFPLADRPLALDIMPQLCQLLGFSPLSVTPPAFLSSQQ